MKVSSFHPQGKAGLSHHRAGLSGPHGQAELPHSPGVAGPPDGAAPSGGAGPPGVRRRAVLAGGLALGLGAVAGCSSSPTSSSSSSGKSMPTLKVLAFQAPSLGAFITSVITAKRFDTAHGVHLAFSSMPDINGDSMTIATSIRRRGDVPRQRGSGRAFRASRGLRASGGHRFTPRTRVVSMLRELRPTER